MSSLTNKIALVVYGGAIFCAALATSSAVRLAQGGSGIEKNTEVFRRISGSAPQIATEITLERYAPIRPDLFCGPPPPPPPQTAFEPAAAAPETPVVTSVQMAYVLKGTLNHSNPALSRAFIEIPGVEDERAYRIGEMVHGAQIVSISDKAAELRRGDESLYLRVSFEDTGNGSPPTGQEPPPRIERVSRAEYAGRRGGGGGGGRGYSGGSRNSGAQENERQRLARAERRSAREPDPEEILQRLPQTLRNLLDQVDAERRQEILRMEPSERMAVFRSMLKDQKTRQKEDREPRSGEGRRRSPRLTSLTPFP